MASGEVRGSGAPGSWRFACNSAAIPTRSMHDPSWDATPEVMTAFRQLAEVICPILSRCKHRCRRAKIEGSLAALEALSARLRSLLPRGAVSRATLSEFCHELLHMAEHSGTATAGISASATASMDVGMGMGMSATNARLSLPQGPAATFPSTMPRAPMPPAQLPDLPPLSPLRPRATGWEDVDSMYVDPEFRLATVGLTHFYKHRTMEIRLAFVAGFRDALAEILQLGDCTSGRLVGVLDLAGLLDTLQQFAAEITAKFGSISLASLPEQDLASFAQSLSVSPTEHGPGGHAAARDHRHHARPSAEPGVVRHHHGIAKDSSATSIPTSASGPGATGEDDRASSAGPSCEASRSASSLQQASPSWQELFMFAGGKRQHEMDTDNDEPEREVHPLTSTIPPKRSKPMHS
ncbi:uncharacterized protein MONBRDRAFT_36037 [Monosiga brevicollis MX1]|uniref:Uncharacterized protein n=1 Tax=Monosiga brevicollis TaxID=81824 RepID=A9URH2_MONBE|nr:uncharacterized protein MONBRDRAFT_36037 [Monosiga brevicollis MX1]EDQ92243.1 predicted protein [Monosiga brevicollis MX1]|eukprot:XP_001743529.1 hypothetical protein [Monosiga brevicollis MX1]